MNDKIIKVLNKLSVLLLLKGENIFKVAAYRNAAEIIKSQNIDIQEAVRNNTLGSIKGFGKALQEKITDYVQNGEMQYYKKLIAEIPPGLIELNKISNIGPKKARELYYKHNITDLDELEDAAKSGRLIKIKGFGEKSNEIILNSIQHRKASRGRFLMHLSQEESHRILTFIDSLPSVDRVSLTDINRRFADTIDNLNFITSTNDPEYLVNNIKQEFFPVYSDSVIRGKTPSDIPLKIIISNEKDYVLKLHESTGSGKYLERFNQILSQKGYSVINDRLIHNGQEIELNSEKQLYEILDIQYVEPELRERPEILNKAILKEIPELIEMQDMKGMIHVHSNWSDGAHSIREMAIEAKAMGYSYIVMCDHSRSASYAGGLTIEQVAEQHEEIDQLNSEISGIKILKGIESDILADGSLDYPVDILKKFDIVVSSVHSHFNLPKKEMTKRIIYALMSPYTTILGHPTGRLLLARKAYPIDMDEIIKAAADNGKIIEINSNPYRLDLSWENAMKAKDMGVKIAINPDSHETETMKEVYFGVQIARKAGLTKNDVVNCLNYNEFMSDIVNK